ncbi:MAG: hypothetical protein KKD18_02030 [Nanoarchaeota archaeon]|nr:hypothetical protein [Nanoarchaeota archaeon]MBU0977170.1 hypothetical protein [Nanoarchaeota archaeon]
MDSGSNKLVEAIEDGRIVKVPEYYAKREGLLILKKAPIQIQKTQTPSYFQHKEDRTKPLTEYIKSKPDWREKQVMSELVDNFHWQIRYTRRRLGITRKQLAKMVGVSENDLQIIESGRLPSNDFILINKVQKTLGINLRKDGKEFDLSAEENLSAEEIMEKAREKDRAKPVQRKSQTEDYSEVVGEGIEILEDEI